MQATVGAKPDIFRMLQLLEIRTKHDQMRPPMTLKHDLVPIVLSILTEKWAIQGQKEALWGLEKLDWSRESAILKYPRQSILTFPWHVKIPVTQKMADAGNCIVMWRKPESHLAYNRYAFVWLLAYPKSLKEMRNTGGPQERDTWKSDKTNMAAPTGRPENSTDSPPVSK